LYLAPEKNTNPVVGMPANDMAYRARVNKKISTENSTPAVSDRAYVSEPNFFLGVFSLGVVSRHDIALGLVAA